MTQAERDRLVAVKKAKKRLITQKQAAEELGITERHVRRLLRDLQRRGDKVVAHGLRGLPSNRKLSADTEREADVTVDASNSGNGDPETTQDISRISLRRSLGICGLPTGRDFQRQRRRKPLRCQRMKVSGWTFTRAPRQENMCPRMTIISRVESLARCGFSVRCWNKASCLRRERFSPASARRDRETSTRRRTRSHATKDSVVRLCVSSWKTEPGMNA